MSDAAKRQRCRVCRGYIDNNKTAVLESEGVHLRCYRANVRYRAPLHLRTIDEQVDIARFSQEWWRQRRLDEEQ